MTTHPAGTMGEARLRIWRVTTPPDRQWTAEHSTLAEEYQHRRWGCEIATYAVRAKSADEAKGLVMLWRMEGPGYRVTSSDRGPRQCVPVIERTALSRSSRPAEG